MNEISGSQPDRSGSAPAAPQDGLAGQAARGVRLEASRWIRWGIVLLTLAGGGAVRLWYPDDQQFGADEAIALILGKEWLDHPYLVSHGMYSGGGVNNPPMSVYLFAAVFWLSGGDPERASLVIVAFNLIGLAMAGGWLLVASRRLPLFWAWWALAALCLNPWMVIYSGDVLAQSLLLPFAVLSVIGLAEIWSPNPWRPRILLGIISVAVTSQIHMSGILWAVALYAGVVLFWPSGRRREFVAFLAASAGVFVVLYVPWLIHLATSRSGYTPGSPTGTYLGVFRQMVEAFSAVWAGTGYRQLDTLFNPEQGSLFYSRMGLTWKVLQYVSLAAFALATLGAMLAVRRSHRSSQSEGLIASLVVALCLFPLLSALIRARPCPHYAIVSAFGIALLAASGLMRVEQWARPRSRLRWATRALAVVLLATQLWTTAGFLRHVHDFGGTGGESGVLLRVRLERVRALRHLTLRDFFARKDLHKLEYLYLKDYLQDGRISISTGSSTRN
jgi:4-amino-4-deoxy-L-arabinose transferase-like glycosyltransferase